MEFRQLRRGFRHARRHLAPSLVALALIGLGGAPAHGALPPHASSVRESPAPAVVLPPTFAAYIKASNTEDNDIFGSGIAADGDTLVISAGGEDSGATGVNGNQQDNSVNSAGAAYVFVRNGSTWSQQAYLKASNPGVEDRFDALAISGDTIVIGAAEEDSDATGVNGPQNNNNSDGAGAAYVFVRNGSTWSQQAYLKASNTGSIDRFGSSVAISGDTIVVGSSSESSSATGVGGDQTDNSARDSGAAYVFVRNGTTWTQQAYLKASNTDAGDIFGVVVAIAGDTIAVGAINESSAAAGVDGDQTDNSLTRAGAVYIFGRNGTSWA